MNGFNSNLSNYSGANTPYHPKENETPKSSDASSSSGADVSHSQVNVDNSTKTQDSNQNQPTTSLVDDEADLLAKLDALNSDIGVMLLKGDLLAQTEAVATVREEVATVREEVATAAETTTIKTINQSESSKGAEINNTNVQKAKVQVKSTQRIQLSHEDRDLISKTGVLNIVNGRFVAVREHEVLNLLRGKHNLVFRSHDTTTNEWVIKFNKDNHEHARIQKDPHALDEFLKLFEDPSKPHIRMGRHQVLTSHQFKKELHVHMVRTFTNLNFSKIENEKMDTETVHDDKNVDTAQKLTSLEPGEAKKLVEELDAFLKKLSMLFENDMRRQELEQAILLAKSKEEKEFFCELMQMEIDRIAKIDAGHHQKQKEPIILNINPEDFLRERGFKV